MIIEIIRLYIENEAFMGFELVYFTS